MRKIHKIDVFKTYESCQRTTYYVRLTTDDGMEITPHSFATGSVYTHFVGLSMQEARDRALVSAADWGDLLQIDVEPYVEDGVRYEPSWVLDSYKTQRKLREKGK